MKTKIVVFLLILNCGLFAQQTSIVIKSVNENKLFRVKINNFLLNKTLINNLKVTGLLPQGKYFLEVQFENDTTIFKTPVKIIDVGFYHLYLVNEKGIHLKKIAPDYEAEETYHAFGVVKFGAKPIELVDTILKTDAVLIDTSEHYHAFGVADYNGKIGCPWPIKDDDFANFKINLNNQRLEDDKLQFARNYLTNQCLTTKQIVEVLLVFEYEETKLDFTMFIYKKTFDIDNFITEIRPHFKFENSLDKLKQEFKIVEKKKE